MAQVVPDSKFEDPKSVLVCYVGELGLVASMVAWLEA
jgi:hypothetical protein